MKAMRWILIGFMSFTLVMTGQPAAAHNAARENALLSLPLERLLNPDGTLNLNGSFSGSVDPSGWRMSVDSSGAPRFTRTATSTTAAGDEFWDDDFLLGVSYTSNPEFAQVYAIAVGGTDVYVGGVFDRAGNVAANNIAKWDTVAHRWSALGSGTDNRISAIAVDGADVYVGGNFTTAGGTNALSIARWNEATQTWSALGAGLGISEGVRRVAEITIAGNGDVYAGGRFDSSGDVAVRNIARWNGSAWQALGDGVYDATPSDNTSYVYAIATSGADVYVGGEFWYAGGDEAHNVARWDGSAWHPVGGGIGGEFSIVNDIVVSGSYFYFGGIFHEVYDASGAHSAGHVAMWDGSAWDTLGGGLGGEDLEALAVGPDGIYAGGSFSELADGTTSANNLARWDGSAWHAVGGSGFAIGNDGVDNIVYALAELGDQIYLGGRFTASNDGLSLGHIGFWDVVDEEWYALGNSVNGPVYALALRGDEVYLGGGFTSAGGVKAWGIVRWNKQTSLWSNLGVTGATQCTGALIGRCRPAVYAIKVDGDDVYIGGNFVNIGSEMNGIARWDAANETWNALGDGISCDGFNCLVAVRTIDVHEGPVFVGGDFDTAGGIPAQNIAKWDGSTWSAVGSGTNGTVYVVDAQAGDTAEIGGSFTVPGEYVAECWPDIGCSPWWMGGWVLNDTVRILARDPTSSTTCAGGLFTDAGGNTNADHIACINNAAWAPRGAGFDGNVYTLANIYTHFGGLLYAGGAFTASGVTGLSRIARWDGQDWTGLGSGVDNDVYALLVDGNKVYAGGAFTTAGGKPSFFFGRWGSETIYLPVIVK